MADNNFKYEHLDAGTYDELFRVRRNVVYHNHRRRFFESWNAITVALGALGATSASWAIFSAIATEFAWIPAAIALIAGIFGAVDLAVGTGRQASLHADLSTRYTLLERYFIENEDLSQNELKALRLDQVNIRATEPPILKLLDAMCHYEVLRSFGGDPAKAPSIAWRRRVMKHFLSQATFARSLQTKHSNLAMENNT